jgi:hypothetical protein
MDKILCPSCGKPVEIDKAIRHQLQDKIRLEEAEKVKAQYEKEKAEEAAAREKKLREELEAENREKEKRLQAEKDELVKKLEQEEKTRKEIEEKTREEAIKKAEEEQRLKLKEKDLQIEQIKKIADNFKKEAEELRKKTDQGSQQLQGEALEIDFEEKLRSTFPNDDFLPVPKGVEGGDIWQKIYHKGVDVGSILWETKRTKAWQRSWLAKLRADTRKINATECIIVTETLPPKISTITRTEGVWITRYDLAINLAQIVRFLIVSVQMAKSSASHSDEDLKKIKDYMLSDKFRHTMESHFEHLSNLRKNQNDQIRVMQKLWRDNERNLNELDSNISSLYFDLKDIVPNLPSVKILESTLLASGDDETAEQTLF